ncbi:MAG: WD40/YVTN/BNR-like repeat-containing protein, partial [Maioricimonas sp. JB049]
MRKLIVATGEDLICCIHEQEAQWRASVLTSGRGMQCLAVDSRRPGVLYAGSRGTGVWRSDSFGNDWTRLEFPEADVFALAASPADGAVYAGTEPSKLFVSRDDGQSWRELTALQDIPSRPTWSFPPRPWTSHVRSIAPNPHEARLLLVGI